MGKDSSKCVIEIENKKLRKKLKQKDKYHEAAYIFVLMFEVCVKTTVVIQYIVIIAAIKQGI